LLPFCLVSTPSFYAQTTRPTEYQVKAAYLFNFGKFVTWPQARQGSGTFSVCVLGQDPFGGALEATVRDETIDGLPLTAQHITRPEAAANCRIVFVSSSDRSHLATILDVLNHFPVLTVSDMPEFCSHGGMIEFVLEGDRIRFAVNLVAAERARLKMSSDLLKVASRVITGSDED
jgi:hypothetical protein